MYIYYDYKKHKTVFELAHYSALCNKLITGELHCVDDLVTYKLDLCRFAQDVIRECKEPAFLHEDNDI